MAPSKKRLYPLMVLLGVVAGGLAVTFGFVAILGSATPFENFHAALPNQEFGMSIGQDIYFLSVSLGILLGAIAVFRSNLNAYVRSFIFGFAISLLGFFTLCDFMSIGDMSSVRHR